MNLLQKLDKVKYELNKQYIIENYNNCKNLISLISRRLDANEIWIFISQDDVTIGNITERFFPKNGGDFFITKRGIKRLLRYYKRQEKRYNKIMEKRDKYEYN